MSTRMNESQIKFRILQKHETTFQTEDSLLLLFGLEGSSEAYIEDRKYILGTGGILAVEPGKLYRISALRSSLIVLHVPAQIRKAAGERRGYSYSYHCYSKDDEGIQPLFLPVRERYAALFYEYLQNHHEVSGAAQGNLMQLLRYLREHFSTEREVRSAADGSGGGQRGRNPETDQKAAELLRLIDEQWNEELSLSILAERAHFSVSYLSRYFQKITSMGFSAYLRKVRLIHARQFLMQGELSITQIAYDCGFRNPSVFIETFKQEYGMTPGQFRQGMMDAAASPAAAAPMRDQRSDLSALLAYMPEKETDEISLRKETIEIDCAGGEGNTFSGFSGGNITGERSQEKSAQENDSKENDSKGKDSRGKDAQGKGSEIIKTQEKSGLWERILNIGYAREGLLAEVQNQIRRAQAEVGFTYFRCHGLLDGDMYIYREDEGGNPYYTFSNMDALFDFVTELGLTPIVELGFMPEQLAKEQRRIFDRPSVISGCAQPEKWKDLICAVVEHLAARYGQKTLRNWKFTTISLSYVRIGCLSREDYEELYEMTYRTVKDIDPQLQFGGAGYFPDLTEDREIGVPWFLEYASSRGCLPDFHTMQWYPCIRTDDSLFMEYTLNQHSAPALLSTDPDHLHKKLDELEKLFREYHVEGRELFLEECNSTLWQRDLSSDTCYKAVWMAKNMAISAGRAVFGYWLLTDFIEERAYIRSVYHGGYGLFTRTGIPKAGYHAMCMIGQMGPDRVASGNGWFLTRKNDSLQLLVYNYTHYSDINCFRYKRLDAPADAYSVFKPGEKMQLQFQLRGLPVSRTDRYRITRTLLSREHGSSFDLWLRLQAPPGPSGDETAYMKKHAVPAGKMEILECRDTLLIDVVLMPLEMELLTIEPV
ncbi:MAG: helix-turn-helix domain-containing protein [Lachnospiraceae bacterium]|nr:helix-turn-helix domain-containing protein [Lachnospiraceae bacterium]